MAWEWSHTQDAYDNARANLGKLPRETLEVIWSEWKATKSRSLEGGFSITLYDDWLWFLRYTTQGFALSNEDLIADIWGWTERQRTCDNGGFNAWVCPFGCHTVSFDPEGEEDVDQEAA